MKAQRHQWQAAARTLFLQWVVWVSITLAGVGGLLLGWDLFLSRYYGVRPLDPLEALGLWILVGLCLVPIIAVIELVRSR